MRTCCRFQTGPSFVSTVVVALLSVLVAPLSVLVAPLSVLVAPLSVLVAPLSVLVAPLHGTEMSGADTVLFDGKDLSGWRRPTGEWQLAKQVTSKKSDPKAFAMEKGVGVMVNGPNGKTTNIISTFEHGDVEAHVEFCVPQGSNSGVYFMGRYEVQVLDSWGVEPNKLTYTDCGGIYQRWKNNRGYEGHAPRVNACKAPGQWQSFDVVFRAPRFDSDGKKIENARFVKVVHNGKVVHENVAVTGPTRAATYERVPEKPRGPLMLQGDHGPVAYRNIKLKSVKLD